MIYQELYSCGQINSQRKCTCAVCFTPPETCQVFDHLLLPASMLGNTYIQFRGCDWWRDSGGFILKAEMGPLINSVLMGATQINKEGFFSSVAGGTV